MKTLFKRGNSQQNNTQALGVGEISIDIEKKAIRIHDGVTPGGFEILGTQAVIPPETGPGEKFVLAGDDALGWYGTVAATDFINGPDLALAVGLSAGNSLYPDSDWMKFAHQDRILFIPKQCLRHALSWDQLNALGLVYGETTVVIKGLTYKVRLIQGAANDPALSATDAGREWNDLIYRVSDGDPTQTFWARYTNAELNVAGGNGTYTWCQEKYSSSDRVYRGLNGVTSMNTVSTTYTGVAIGWRPVLELVL
jgi:hypothetical protein